jgi:hypothetical protein
MSGGFDDVPIENVKLLVIFFLSDKLAAIIHKPALVGKTFTPKSNWKMIPFGTSSSLNKSV